MHETTIDHDTRTVRPLTPEGDEWFGLTMGSNGSAALMRRAGAPAGYTWTRHNGRHAHGLNLQAHAHADTDTTPNPWDGVAAC